MRRKKIYLIMIIHLGLLLGLSGFLYLIPKPTQPKAVQGVETQVFPTQMISTTPTSSPSATPLPTRIVQRVTPTPPVKTVGAWYWKSDLGRAQRYLGLDKKGGEIWTDTGDPTPTPTQQPESPHRSFGSIEQKVNSPKSVGVGVSVRSVSKP